MMSTTVRAMRATMARVGLTAGGGGGAATASRAWWFRRDAAVDDGRHPCRRRRRSSSSVMSVGAASAARGGDDDDDDGATACRVVVGELHVITGPMFAGKTSALLRRVRDERARGRRVFVAKSALDTRFGDARGTTLTTHDGKRCAGAFAVGDLLSLSVEAERALEASDVVAIDEAQFLANLAPFARRCVERDGKTVYVAGLDGDFKREKFGDVLDLLPMCDTVTRLRGKCSMCGADSLFSLRTTTTSTSTSANTSANTNGGGRGDDDDADTDVDAKVVVGGADKYAPACRQCYVAHVVAR